MKKILCFAAAVSLALSLPGCGRQSLFSNNREVEDLELVRTVGVDGDGSKIKITAASATGMTRDGPLFFQSEAATLSQAINDMQRLPMGRQALFSHTEHIIISEKTAEAGLDGILDYIERSPDMRLETNLFIAKGEDAAELMTEVSGKDSDVSDLLSFVQENVSELGAGYVFTCREVSSYLSDSGCALIQTVEVEEQEKLYEGEAEKTLVPTVFAVIKDGKLADFLTEEESFGAALVMNKLKGKYVTVTAEGSDISLAINGAKAEIEPRFSENGELTEIKIKLRLDSNVTSVGGGALLSRDEVREKASAELSRLAEESVNDAIRASKEINADFMRIWKQIEIKHPEKFRKLSSWDEAYKTVSITVTAESTIRRTFDIEDPVGTEGEGVKTVWGSRIK